MDDLECYNEDRLGMEAIRSLHRQLDDDDNGNIDLSESDDVSKPVSIRLDSILKSIDFCCFFSKQTNVK